MEDKIYHRYLLRRSIKSLLYRRYYLYPVITKYIEGRVLDVGCGIGDYLKYNKRAVGVDVSGFSVDFCKSQGLNAQVMTEGRIPYPDRYFDSVMLDNVLEHIDDPSSLLEEIRRVTRIGAVFAIGIPGLKGYLADPDHKRNYDEYALERLLQKYDFTLIGSRHMPFFKSELLSAKLKLYCSYFFFRNCLP